jgi:hypothetical protein
MARLPSRSAVALAAPLLLAVNTSGRASDVPSYTDVDVKLEASDLDAITMHLVTRFPILSASPGIKHAQGFRGAPGVGASVIYFPHSESRGVKNAIQAHCRLERPFGQWTCPAVELRRYVKLDTQDFEVRVNGDLDMAGILGITEATRPLAASAVADATAASTLIVIVDANGGYLLSWGTEEGYGTVSVEAHLRDGGHPANSGDWEAFVLPEHEN